MLIMIIADILIGSLSEHVLTKSEQLEIVNQLETENKEASQRLARAQALAVSWKQRIKKLIVD